MPVMTHEWTDEELLAVQHGGKTELVDGELMLMTPAGGEQGELNVVISSLLLTHVKKNGLGKVYDAQTGFRPENKNMRASDVAFVRTERLPGGKSPRGGSFMSPPIWPSKYSRRVRISAITMRSWVITSNGAWPWSGSWTPRVRRSP